MLAKELAENLLTQPDLEVMCGDDEYGVDFSVPRIGYVNKKLEGYTCPFQQGYEGCLIHWGI